MRNEDELQVYSGPVEQCNNCERVFKAGEVITVADEGKLAFCHTSEDTAKCIVKYVIFKMPLPTHRPTQDQYVFRAHSVPLVKSRRWWAFWKQVLVDWKEGWL